MIPKQIFSAKQIEFLRLLMPRVVRRNTKLFEYFPIRAGERRRGFVRLIRPADPASNKVYSLELAASALRNRTRTRLGLPAPEKMTTDQLAELVHSLHGQRPQLKTPKFVSHFRGEYPKAADLRAIRLALKGRRFINTETGRTVIRDRTLSRWAGRG